MTTQSKHGILEINGVPWISLPQNIRLETDKRIDTIVDLEKEIGGEYVGSCFGVKEFEVRPVYTEDEKIRYNGAIALDVGQLKSFVKNLSKWSAPVSSFSSKNNYFYIFIYPNQSKRYFRGFVLDPAVKDRLARTHGIYLTDDNFFMWLSIAKVSDLSNNVEHKLNGLKRIIVIQEEGETEDQFEMCYDKACQIYDHFSDRSKDLVGITFVEITKNGELK